MLVYMPMVPWLWTLMVTILVSAPQADIFLALFGALLALMVAIIAATYRELIKRLFDQLLKTC